MEDVLSQPSQLLSCFSQSSLIRSPPPSSLSRSNIFSVETISQSFSSQSLSATATPFNPKCQNFWLNSLAAPLKFQTLTASPPFHNVFSSPLKITSDHKPFAKPIELITPPISAFSSFEPLQSSQLKFQPTSSIPLPLLYIVTSPCTSYFSIPSYTHSSLLTHHFLLLYLHLGIILHLIVHQKYYLQLQVLLYMLHNT